jgi:tetratricopeptide (TPR) repeat protein
MIMNVLFILLTTLFLDANTQYAEGNYAEAAAMYEQVLVEEPSAEVYYNLGNAYFKQAELGQAILAYERALRIKPSYKDAQYNLQFAQSKIIDNIEDTSTFFLSNWILAIRNSLGLQMWMFLSIALFVVMLLGVFVFAFSQTVWLRKVAFYCSIFALVLSIVACANAGSLHRRDSIRSEAIIMQGVVNVKSSPDRSGTDLFTIHEGTKVKITDHIGDWCCVQVGHNIGWMQEIHLERI